MPPHLSPVLCPGVPGGDAFSLRGLLKDRGFRTGLSVWVRCGLIGVSALKLDSPGPAESGPWRVGAAAFTLPGPSAVPGSPEPSWRTEAAGKPLECPLVLQLSCPQALPWRNVTGKPFPAMGHTAPTRSGANGRVPGSWEGGRRWGLPTLLGSPGPCPGPAAVPYSHSVSGLTERAGAHQTPGHLPPPLLTPPPVPLSSRCTVAPRQPRRVQRDGPGAQTSWAGRRWSCAASLRPTLECLRQVISA